MPEEVVAELSFVYTLELLVVPDFVARNHPEGSQGHQLTLLLDRVDGVGQPILLQIVFGLHFHHFLLIRVHLLCFLWLLLLAFRLAVYQHILRVAGEGEGIELVCVIFVELVWCGQLGELEVVLAGWEGRYL